MNNKGLLLATTIIITVLGIVTAGSITQALGQESATSNSNNNSTATASTVGSPLYNLTINDKSYPIKFNITGGILDTMGIKQYY